jgi:hypothetical protein
MGEWASGRMGEDPKKITKGRKGNLISTYKLSLTQSLSAQICVHLRFVFLCAFALDFFCLSPRRRFAVSPIRRFALELHSNRPLHLKWHLRVNLICAVVSADDGPILLVRKIQHINPQFDIFPSIEDARVQCELGRYHRGAAISEIDRASDLSPKTEP